jgi:hypothetical protein
MNTTSAMSLQYECIQTCTIGLADHLPTIKLCIQKLRSFVEDPDQNCKKFQVEFSDEYSSKISWIIGT